ncbi:hypothetical protein [uncultured Porphyromonas sp.]|uniref:hypothetical protein n=1 Tax=uncultured Porphyromonas sp. TaxID=159274 RepID=UPI00263321EA|nr:hypothetical protein [uncultured Porphyromonas sp.]
MGKINVAKLLGIGAGIALGTYLVRQYLRKYQALRGNYSPLIDQVLVTTDGEKSERWLFDWDDEERCKIATKQSLDKYGQIFSESHLTFDFQEESIEVCHYLNDSEYPEEIASIYLNSYDVVTAIVRRFQNGKEERWDASINGAELSQLTTGEATTKMYWSEGNLEGISYGGETRKKMTYYRDKENYLFPDINLFAEGFGEEMLCTYVMGTRSRHFLRTMSVTGPNYHRQSHVSYLLDSFDRPIQMLVEDTILDNDITTNSSREFDIKYKKL